MAEQTSVLKVGISGAGAKVGAADFKNATEQMKKDAKQLIKDMKQSFKDLYDEVFNMRNLIGAIGLGALAKDIIATNVEFQRLEANLKTVTGSAMGARAAFGELQKFAASTPFSLRGLTQAFTTLKLSGIDTSEKSLTAFGNIAASFGRDITELATAMKSAMAGEFESLSSFGPKVTTVGNKYVVMFQGMRYEIEKNGKALENFVINLGNTKFAGGMENQMQTLAGVWSNIGDNFDRLKSQIGAGGLNQALKEFLDWLNKLTAGGDQTAKKIGSVLGDAIRSLTGALQLLVANFHIVEDVMRGLAVYALVSTLIAMGRALYASAKAWDAMAAAMARNPVGLIAVGISIVISYLIEWYQESKRVEAQNAALREETDQMMKQFKEADTSSLENVLANSTAIANEIQRTNDGLLDASANTTELARRMAFLKDIETQSAEQILNFISQLSTEKSSALIASASAKVETPADLKKQLATLKDQREKMIDDLVDAGSAAGLGARIVSGEKSVAMEQTYAMPGGGTGSREYQATGTDVIDPEKVRQMGKEFVTKLADADRLMQQIKDVETKLAVKSGKVSAQAAKKALNELNTSLENMRAGIVNLEADAAVSGLQLSTFLALGDGPEAQKLISFKQKYNDITKNGTIPITAEETARIKAATSAIVDNNVALQKQQSIRNKTNSLVEDIQKAQWDNFIDLKVPPGLQEIERQLVEIMIELKISKEEAEKFRDALTYIAGKRAEIAKRDVGRNYSEQLNALEEELSLLGESSIEIQKQTMLRALLLDLQKKGISYSQEELQGWIQQIDKIAQAQQKIDRLSSIKGFIESNNDLMKSLADFSVSAIDQIADAWVNFTETGKFNFKEFADFVYKEITKIIIKFLIAKAIESSISAFGGGAGGFNPVGVGRAHEGGAVSSLSNSHPVSASVFQGAQRYALGGIPGMKPGEVPIVAHREEAIVPLPSGKGIPVDLRGANTQGGGDTINVNINGVSDFDSFKRNSGAVSAEVNKMLVVNRRRNQGKG